MVDYNKFYIRFLNAVSDLGEVEFYVNNKLISSLYYKGFSEYYPANVGTYKVSVHLKSTKELLAEEVLVFEHDVYTFALTGLKEELSLNVIKSENEKPINDKAIIRLCNLAPYNTNYNIYVNDTLAVEELGYEEITEYFSLNGGTYSLKYYNVDNNELVLTDPKLQLKNGKIYTAYVVGVKGQGAGLQVLIPLEGTTYIEI